MIFVSRGAVANLEPSIEAVDEILLRHLHVAQRLGLEPAVSHQTKIAANTTSTLESSTPRAGRSPMTQLARHTAKNPALPIAPTQSSGRSMTGCRASHA